MKKLLSVLLVVAMLATSCCVFATSGVSAAGVDINLMSQFGEPTAGVTKSGGEGTIAVAKDGDAYTFTADKGWPEASFDWTSAMKDTTVGDKGTGLFLNFEFDVTAGANILLFFNGQNPSEEDATKKNSVSLNYLIDNKNKAANGDITDLKAGTYKQSVSLDAIVKEIDVTEAGDIQFSGIKVFAVGGVVTMKKLNVSGATEPTVTQGTGTTTAKAGTTTAKAGTTTASNAKTGWEDNIALYAIVALGAAAVVTVTVVSGKKAKSK